MWRWKEVSKAGGGQSGAGDGVPGPKYQSPRRIPLSPGLTRIQSPDDNARGSHSLVLRATFPLKSGHLTTRQITGRLEATVGIEHGYDKVYDTFDSPLSRQIRYEAHGVDVGQHSWVTASELNAYIAALRLGADTRLLDIGCGPAGPLTYIAAKVG